MSSPEQSIQTNPRAHKSTVGDMAAEVADAVRRHVAGDHQAMADVVKSATPWLFHICRGYRLSTQTAEDVVQSTLLALLRNAHNLRDPQCALSWLTVVARREALRAIKVEGRIEPAGDMTTLDYAMDRDSPELVLEAKMLRRAIQRNLGKLPRRRRDLLRLAFLSDNPDYASIAQALDMPIGSIGPTRQRGLAAMRELLDADREWCRCESA